MATFQYIAQKASGDEVRGTVEADDRQSAVSAVRAQGLLPTTIGEVRQPVQGFSEKTVGELLIPTGDVRGNVRLQYLAGVGGNQDGVVRIYSYDDALGSRIQTAIMNQWPDAKIENLDGTLFVSCPETIGQSEGRKVAIVGVEGSGKTVMLAGLGNLFSQPNEDGVFITPKNFKTLTYVDRLISVLKSGKWPSATGEDVMEGLDWVIRQRVDDGRPVQKGEISLLDFAGEVYRAAFVLDNEKSKELEEQVASLKKYLADADCVLVLVNLSDVIANGSFNPRVEESVWITNAILDFVLPENSLAGKKMPRAAIVLSQSDNYADTIADCGGPKQTLQRYLPHVANNYGWLDTFAACTVDKTDLDDDGHPVPSPDFTTKGLAPIMEWVLKS